MARLSGVSTDSFSASARGRRLSVASVIGLGSILRDQKSTLPSTQSASSIVGTAARVVTSKSRFSSSPMDPISLLEADNHPNSSSSSKEDIWPNLDMRSTSDAIDSRSVMAMDELSFAHNQMRLVGCENAGSARENGFSYMENGHTGSAHNLRSRKGGGLATALKNLGSVSSSSPLYRASDMGEPIPVSAPSLCHPISGHGRRKPGARKNSVEDLLQYPVHQSAPVNVPDWTKIRKQERNESQNHRSNSTTSYDNDEDDDERIPPHELIARERARNQTITFSVCEGQGRTLKGRDMCRMRNAVWKQMGLLVD